jgi:hypothetical protein
MSRTYASCTVDVDDVLSELFPVDHFDGSRSYIGSTRPGGTVHLAATDPAALRLLAQRLTDAARQWDADLIAAAAAETAGAA